LERRALAAVQKATALLRGATQYKKANVRVVAVDELPCDKSGVFGFHANAN
jgi:hypothetical protein